MISDNLILDKAQIVKKIRRIAFEIYENNYAEKEVVLAGIYDTGYDLAKRLMKELKSISPLKITLIRVTLNKKAVSQSEIELDCEPKVYQKKCVILVDDVLSTGRTLAYSMRPFLKVDIKKLEIAVLVNRGHSLFPIMSNYTGYELSTTLNEHIEVNFTGSESGVFLH